MAAEGAIPALRFRAKDDSCNDLTGNTWLDVARAHLLLTARGVMLKISRLSDSERSVVLRLEGQVMGVWVDELRRICDELRTASHDRDLTLDLAEVSFLDSDGVALLRQLVTDHVSITNYSVFVAEQLKEGADVER